MIVTIQYDNEKPVTDADVRVDEAISKTLEKMKGYEVKNVSFNPETRERVLSIKKEGK